MVGDVGHGEAEMKALGIAHRSIATRNIGMDGIIGLHISECRDDDAPDALNRIKREQAAMTLGQTTHHFGLAARAESRATTLARLSGDQAVDDLATLHQQTVHVRINPVDIDTEFTEDRLRILVGVRIGGHGRGLAV